MKHPRFRVHLSLLLTLLFSMLGWLSVQPVQAADPGEIMASSVGLVPPSSQVVITLYETGNANLSLKVPASVSTENLTLALMSGTNTLASWKIYSGEQVWGFATIPAGARLEIRNAGPNSLPYELAVYARAQLPAIANGLASWNGIANGTGIQSSAQFDVTQAGLYRFAMTATSGAYQLSVDNNAILKTASASFAPNPNDTTYYLSAGVHTFTILQQGSVAQTAWDVALSFVGGIDTLPNTESSSILGGFASQERIPLQLEGASLVNIRLVVNGPATEGVVVALYNGETKVAESTKVFGGELVWFTGSVVAGANTLQIGTDSPSALGYDIAVSAVAEVPVSVTGTSYGAPAHTSGGNSSARFNFPKAGLYAFQLTAGSGRFQFVLGQNFLQRTVDTSEALSFTAYVPEGIQSIALVQDSALARTDWSLTITPTEATNDVLPFSIGSRSFGKTNDIYTMEWVPLNFNAAQPINMLIKAKGAATDALSIELFHGEAQVGSANTVYGGEEIWISTSIAAGLNRLHIQTAANNTAAISYEITLIAVPSIPNTAAGISYGQGLNSTLTVMAPLDGIYTFTITFSEGTGIMLIDETTNISQLQALPANASQTVVRVPLKSGLHRVTMAQSSAVARSVWTLDMQAYKLNPWIVSLPIVMN